MDCPLHTEGCPFVKEPEETPNPFGPLGVAPVTQSWRNWIALTAVLNSAGFLMLLGWMVKISFDAGSRSTQLDVDTAMIESINQNGSMGTRQAIQDIAAQFRDLQETLRGMSSRIDKIVDSKR